MHRIEFMILLNIFINNLELGTNQVVARFADDNQLFKVVKNQRTSGQCPWFLVLSSEPCEVGDAEK